MTEPTTDHSQQNGINGTHEHSERNAWSSPGPAAFDFRSMPFHSTTLSNPPQLTSFPPTSGDVVTTPTPSMLRAIQTCTLLDDVFAEDPTTTHLERTLSSLTGHASALLVLSGTMGNQLAIRTHMTQPPHSLLCDARSHIAGWEAGGCSSLTGAFPILVTPANGHHLTLSDVKAHISLPSPSSKAGNEILNIHRAPTTLICLENTLNGSILPLSSAREISQWAHSQDPPIKMHLDGARLWEAVSALAAATTTTSDDSAESAPPSAAETLTSILRDYCACFDSVSLCFSKGLCAPIGSILTSPSPQFIRRARHVRKSLGGGVRQAGVIAAPALVAVQETFLGGKLKGSHEVARRVAGMWEDRGGKLLGQEGEVVETNMCWFDMEGSGVEEGEEEWVEAGVREGVKLAGGRVVCHVQVGEEGVRRLGRVMDAVLKGKNRKPREEEEEEDVKEQAKGIREEGEAME
ncbi:MAG: hypothetical protein Q9208_002657 [Pyrenodesmia sp. 3 TL-2023]